MSNYPTEQEFAELDNVTENRETLKSMLCNCGKVTFEGIPDHEKYNKRIWERCVISTDSIPYWKLLDIDEKFRIHKVKAEINERTELTQIVLYVRILTIPITTDRPCERCGKEHTNGEIISEYDEDIGSFETFHCFDCIREIAEDERRQQEEREKHEAEEEEDY